MADDKGAPEEEMIEKPREQLFSKAGFMVLLGSNIIVALLIVVVVFMVGGSGDPAADDANAMDETTKPDILDPTREYLKVEGNTAYVKSSGATMKKVSFTFLLSFDSEDQATKKSDWSTGERQEKLSSIAEKFMAKYRLDEIRDSNFLMRFERQFKAHLNAIMDKDNQIKSVTLRQPTLPNN